MARFIDEDGNEWAEGRIRGLDFAEGVYGKVCAVERDGLTLMAKGFKRFEGERGSSGAEMRRDREYDRISRMDGLEGYAPRAYGKGTLEVNGERIPAFLMSYVEGVGFKRAIDILAGSENALLSAAEVLGLARKLVEPFAAMERSGVVHGDLHTENVRIVLSTEGKPVVKGAGLIDFGNARRLGADGRSLYTPTPAERRQMPGSFWFESPESFSCAACPYNEEYRSKPSSNMWAFGALLYYAYYRKLPHDIAARAYSSVWGSLTATEEARVRALQNFIEAKAMPLGLPVNPGDDAEDFRMLAELIRNTTLGDPVKRWTAKQCSQAMEKYLTVKAFKAYAVASPHQNVAKASVPQSSQSSKVASDSGARTLPSNEQAVPSNEQSASKKIAGSVESPLLDEELEFAEPAWLRISGKNFRRRQKRLKWIARLGFFASVGAALLLVAVLFFPVQMLEVRSYFGDARAQTLLGQRYYYGDGVGQDYERAAELLGRAVAQGDAAAQCGLGALYDDGLGVEQSYEKAAELYGQAAVQGQADAQRRLGRLYRYGLGVQQSYEKAVELYTQAANQGDASAQCSLGDLYYDGLGVEQNYERAAELYEQAAAQGYALAQSNLGFLYYSGQGVEQDYEKAVEFLNQAADQGDADAQANLGRLYDEGLGVEQNYERAADLYECAADRGSIAAQCNLGNLYYRGLGVEQSYEKAAELWSQSADQGNITSQYNLGILYYYGRGVEQDTARAAELWRQAAEQGDEDAASALSECGLA
ncbi:MAG TPA: SEL1-like repeat protein [Candidatus Rubneribacter avistercoris]|nr:SEL1-like repeat protein [Candidatus Rubneribacter avistercoris]